MTQLGLNLAVSESTSGWVRQGPPGDKLHASWVHLTSGWRIVHCGHPTALWPYFAEHADYDRCVVVTHNGKGWRHISAARDIIDEVIAGTSRVTAERCASYVRRVLRPGEE